MGWKDLSEFSRTLIIIIGFIIVALVVSSLINPLCIGCGHYVNSSDSQMANQLRQLFSSQTAKVVIYPASRDISLKPGDSSKGFAFSINNTENKSDNFSFIVNLTALGNCSNSVNETTANNYIVKNSGSISIPYNSTSEPQLIVFNIPKNSPKCALEYALYVYTDSGPYDITLVFVEIT